MCLPLIMLSCWPVTLRLYLSGYNTLKLLSICLCCVFFTVSLIVAFPQQLADCLEYDKYAVRFGWASLILFVDILSIISLTLNYNLKISRSMKRQYFLIYIQELVDPHNYLEIPLKELLYCKNRHRIVLCLPCLFLFSFGENINCTESPSSHSYTDNQQ